MQQTESWLAAPSRFVLRRGSVGLTRGLYATLLDEGTYLASERTMYRIRAANNEVRERRNQLRRPNYAAATLPTAVWINPPAKEVTKVQ
jgi:hypothetical protein